MSKRRDVHGANSLQARVHGLPRGDDGGVRVADESAGGVSAPTYPTNPRTSTGARPGAVARTAPSRAAAS